MEASKAPHGGIGSSSLCPGGSAAAFGDAESAGGHVSSDLPGSGCAASACPGGREEARHNHPRPCHPLEHGTAAVGRQSNQQERPWL